TSRRSRRGPGARTCGRPRSSWRSAGWRGPPRCGADAPGAKEATRAGALAPALASVDLDHDPALADEARPAGAELAAPDAHDRRPARADRAGAQAHAGLARRPVGLHAVARAAGRHAVLPRGRPAARAGHDVVDRQPLLARLLAAVLAAPAVAAVERPARE